MPFYSSRHQELLGNFYKIMYFSAIKLVRKYQIK